MSQTGRIVHSSGGDTPSHFEEVNIDADLDADTNVSSRVEEFTNLDDFLTAVHQVAIVGSTDQTNSHLPSLEWIKQNFKTKSAAIRYLGQQRGLDAKVIAMHLRLKYQHVYNVLHQNLKRGPNEVYVEQQWQCPHNKATRIVDVIVRRGDRDPDSSRILYRVCSDCAQGLIPGVTEDSLNRTLPIVKKGK